MKKNKRGLNDLCTFNDYRDRCNRYGRTARALRKNSARIREGNNFAGSTGRDTHFSFKHRSGASKAKSDVLEGIAAGHANYQSARNVNQARMYIELREKDLWAAVLELAIRDLMGSKNREGVTRHIRRNAFKWIWSDKRGSGSFIWVCEALSLNAEALREALIRMKGGVVKIKIKKHISVTK